MPRKATNTAAAEQLVIEDRRVTAILPEGQQDTMVLDAFISKAFPPAVSTGDMILPDGVKTALSRGPVTVYVHQTPPRVHRLTWIRSDSPRPYGPGTTYRTVSLSLPYLIVLAVYVPGEDGKPMLSGSNEAFFRNESLRSLDDELHFPGLLNCSRFKGDDGQLRADKPLSWICTQHLNREPLLLEQDMGKRMRMGFKELMKCMLETGFNYSSEHHEGSSWYTESAKKIDAINPVEKWEERSREEPLFALSQDWLPTGKTLRQMIERIFNTCNAPAVSVQSSKDLARVVFNYGSS